MSKVLNTITIILLVLGILGIILGITVGLYRNDQLARIQITEETNVENGSQISGGEQTGVQTDALTDLVLNGNLHTIFFGAGTFLTLIGAGLFLLSIRKDVS
jgi:hypothetical protein